MCIRDSHLAWHTPALFAEDDADLDLLGDILANGKTSRLYRSLVHERRIALDVAAAQSSRELAGVFQVVATVASLDRLAEVDAAMREEIARLAGDGPTEDELSRVLAQAEAHFVYRLQHIGGFNGKSDQLNAYNVMLGTPDGFERDLARYQRATLASIRAAAARWLDGVPCVALTIVPAGRAAGALPGSVPARVS